MNTTIITLTKKSNLSTLR